jgi:hypothetical protein
MICHGTSNKPAHHSKDCPIFKTIRHKLVKVGSAEGVDAASQAAREAPVSASPPASSPGTQNPPGNQGGLTSAPGAFTAATDYESYDSGEEFEYKGKHEGQMYIGKPKLYVSIYASHTSINIPSPVPLTAPASCHHSAASVAP